MDKEEELKILFESDDEVFFSISAVGDQITFISKSCKKLFGYEDKAFYDNSNLLSLLIHPDFQETFNIGNVLLATKDITTSEFQIINSNGDEKWVRCNTKPLLDSNGNPTHLEGVIKNISQIKRIELDFENKIKELNFYIYRMTHDLRGPISSALGLVYIAKREVKEEPLITYLNKIEESNKKLDSILFNLIEVIRTLKSTVITKELINFKTIINEILSGFEHSPKRKGINIEVKDNSKIEYYSDKKLMNSILLNLIHNSINYHDKSTNASISIEISELNSNLYINVSDNGAGISDDIKSKVYDMFYRGNEDSKGSGLGLYIVKNAVEKLGGKIELISNLGQGTTFNITLPIIQ